MEATSSLERKLDQLIDEVRRCRRTIEFHAAERPAIEGPTTSGHPLVDAGIHQLRCHGGRRSSLFRRLDEQTLHTFGRLAYEKTVIVALRWLWHEAGYDQVDRRVAYRFAAQLREAIEAARGGGSFAG